MNGIPWRLAAAALCRNTRQNARQMWGAFAAVRTGLGSSSHSFDTWASSLVEATPDSSWDTSIIQCSQLDLKLGVSGIDPPRDSLPARRSLRFLCPRQNRREKGRCRRVIQEGERLIASEYPIFCGCSPRSQPSVCVERQQGMGPYLRLHGSARHVRHRSLNFPFGIKASRKVR